MSLLERPSYSATVVLELHVDNNILPLTHVGPDSCILATAATTATRQGEIVVHVDGHVHRTPVELLEPLTPDRRHIAYRQIAE